MFHARKPSPDRVASLLAFVLLLASWSVVIATLIPAGRHPAQVHAAPQVRL